MWFVGAILTLKSISSFQCLLSWSRGELFKLEIQNG